MKDFLYDVMVYVVGTIIVILFFELYWICRLFGIHLFTVLQKLCERMRTKEDGRWKD